MTACYATTEVDYSRSRTDRSSNILPFGKAAGPDGFANDFSKVFNQTLLKHMTGIFNYPKLTGLLPDITLNA
jgi:hypothetical protein